MEFLRRFKFVKFLRHFLQEILTTFCARQPVHRSEMSRATIYIYFLVDQMDQMDAALFF